MATHTQASSQAGFSLVETMIATLVLSVGAMGMAAVFLNGMQNAASSPADLVATQKAAEAVESVFGARDARTVTWAKLRNVADGGIFLPGARPLKVAGADGIVDTADDGAVESVQLPGPDQVLGTADDRTEQLSSYSRQIAIADINQDLRAITVTITYQAGAVTQTYTLTAYISSYA